MGDIPLWSLWPPVFCIASATSGNPATRVLLATSRWPGADSLHWPRDFSLSTDRDHSAVMWLAIRHHHLQTLAPRVQSTRHDGVAEFGPRTMRVRLVTETPYSWARDNSRLLHRLFWCPPADFVALAVAAFLLIRRVLVFHSPTLILFELDRDDAAVGNWCSTRDGCWGNCVKLVPRSVHAASHPDECWPPRGASGIRPDDPF